MVSLDVYDLKTVVIIPATPYRWGQRLHTRRCRKASGRYYQAAHDRKYSGRAHRNRKYNDQASRNLPGLGPML